MEIIDSAVTAYASFIFNWNTYFGSIPIWFILFGGLWKRAIGKIVFDDLPIILICALINPIWYLCLPVFIIVVPTCLLFLTCSDWISKHWDKIKDKKIL